MTNGERGRTAIGVIGCTAAGLRLLDGFHGGRSVRVVGAADPDVGALGRVLRRGAAAAVTTRREAVLRDPLLEALVVAVPLPERAAAVRAALEAGKHVLAAPPMAARGEEAQALVDEATRRGLVLRAAHEARRDAPFLLFLERCAACGAAHVDVDARRCGLADPDVFAEAVAELAAAALAALDHAAALKDARGDGAGSAFLAFESADGRSAHVRLAPALDADETRAVAVGADGRAVELAQDVRGASVRFGTPSGAAPRGGLVPDEAPRRAVHADAAWFASFVPASAVADAFLDAIRSGERGPDLLGVAAARAAAALRG
ncbi:MAG: Gfo/Idh/MocA family oxidoreductase [Candidatus Polarisedimenticolia bacterium]